MKAIRASKSILLLAAIIRTNSYGDEGNAFMSIEQTNKVLQKKSQRLEDVFGQNIVSMATASSVKAVLLGEIDDPGIERYLVFPLKGKFMDIDRQAAKVFYMESNVSMDALGSGKPKFALIYQGERAEKKVVILISPPEAKDDWIWTFIECGTQKSALFSPEVVPLLSKIWKTLKDEEAGADQPATAPESKPEGKVPAIK
jgi:hypothetical protein